MKLSKIILLSGLFIAFPALAAEISTRVVWHAQAIKKPEVKLNVFAGADKMQFHWDNKVNYFNSPTGAITVHAEGKSADSAYKITSQLINNRLDNPAGTAALEIAAHLNQTSLSAQPVDLLAASKQGKTAPAADSDIARINFTIEKASNGLNPALVKVNQQEQLENGTYAGSVEMAFVASWASTSADL
ncbi:MAG: common pilus major fimbrillin subunit EcpA [Iodobacter sp.]